MGHATKCYARGEQIGNQSIQLGYKTVEAGDIVRRFPVMHELTAERITVLKELLSNLTAVGGHYESPVSGSQPVGGRMAMPTLGASDPFSDLSWTTGPAARPRLRRHAEVEGAPGDLRLELLPAPEPDKVVAALLEESEVAAEVVRLRDLGAIGARTGTVVEVIVDV